MKAFACEETGSTAIEYALVAALIGLVIVAAVGNIGSSVQSMFMAVRF